MKACEREQKLKSKKTRQVKKKIFLSENKGKHLESLQKPLRKFRSKLLPITFSLKMGRAPLIQSGMDKVQSFMPEGNQFPRQVYKMLRKGLKAIAFPPLTLPLAPYHRETGANHKTLRLRASLPAHIALPPNCIPKQKE